jgi:hypothetical protein
MRSYIFTKRERQTIADFLSGKIDSGERLMRNIRYRFRLFETLGGDVDLYLELRRRFAEPKTA